MTDVNFQDGTSVPAAEDLAADKPVKAAKEKKEKVHKGDILPVRMYALQCKACDRSTENGKTVSTHWDRNEAFEAREEHYAFHKAQ